MPNTVGRKRTHRWPSSHDFESCPRAHLASPAQSKPESAHSPEKLDSVCPEPRGWLPHASLPASATLFLPNRIRWSLPTLGLALPSALKGSVSFPVFVTSQCLNAPDIPEPSAVARAARRHAAHTPVHHWNTEHPEKVTAEEREGR